MVTFRAWNGITRQVIHVHIFDHMFLNGMIRYAFVYCVKFIKEMSVYRLKKTFAMCILISCFRNRWKSHVFT